MNKIKSLGLGIVTATILFSGCATKELKTVFLSSKNTSGQKINLENTIISELQSKGYTVIDDPEKATYILMVNVLYCDKKQENNAAGGAVAAGAVGAGVAGYNNGGAGGMAAAGLGSALVGGLLAKATEDTIYQMQVDIVIREKAKGPVYSTNTTASGQARVNDSKKSGFVNTFGGNTPNSKVSGQLNSNAGRASSQSYESDFIEHKTVMLAEATKMNLTLQEATPILERQISNQIA